MSCFHLQAISRKSKRRVHYQKFVKVTLIFSILPKIFYCCVVAIISYIYIHFPSQGKDSSNYSADDLGCILGTKSEKVTFWYLRCCSILPKDFHYFSGLLNILLTVTNSTRLEPRPRRWRRKRREWRRRIMGSSSRFSTTLHEQCIRSHRMYSVYIETTIWCWNVNYADV